MSFDIPFLSWVQQRASMISNWVLHRKTGHKSARAVSDREMWVIPTEISLSCCMSVRFSLSVSGTAPVRSFWCSQSQHKLLSHMSVHVPSQVNLYMQEWSQPILCRSEVNLYRQEWSQPILCRSEVNLYMQEWSQPIYVGVKSTSIGRSEVNLYRQEWSQPIYAGVKSTYICRSEVNLYYVGVKSTYICRSEVNLYYVGVKSTYICRSEVNLYM